MDENNLESLMGTETPPNELDVFQQNPGLGLKLPDSVIRNRAATTSLIASAPDKAVENYQLMLAEGMEGQETLTKTLQSEAATKSKSQDMRSLLGMLSDPKLPFEQKQSLVKSFNTMTQEPSTILMTTNLSHGSKGETVEAEQSRLKVADLIGQVNQAIEVEQGLVNNFVSNKDWRNTATIVDTAALWFMPFGTALSAGKVGADQLPEGSTSWEAIKKFLTPGTTIADLRDRFRNIPADERALVTESLLKTISEKSGVIFSSENQHQQVAMANAIVRGEYTDVDKWLDNTVNLLDIVGLGSIIKSSARGAKGAMKGVETVTDVTAKTPTGPFTKTTTEAGLRPRTTEELMGQTAGFQDRLISKLESEKADLMGAAGNQLDAGVVRSLTQELADIRAKLIPTDKASLKNVAKDIQANEGVSYKKAAAEAEKRITDANASTEASIFRIEQQINTNKAASTAMQRIAAIEKEIDQLKAARVDAPGALTPIADLVRRIEMRSVTTTYNPASPAAIIQQVNPERSRSLMQAVFKSENDAVAEGLYGTSKLDALAGDVFPQATTDTGRVTTKPVDMQRNLRNDLDVPDEVLRSALSSGALEYTRAEKAAARANKVNEFASAEGLHLLENMGSFTLEGNQFKISAVYGTPEGSFLNAQQAYDQALYALRHQGVLPQEITILSKEGLDHVPVKLEDVKDLEGNYLVRIDTRSELDPTDITNWEIFDVKRNWLDRLPLVSNSKGSAARMVMDAASMLHPTYTGAAAVASDLAANFEKRMLEFASEFSDQFTKLSKGQQVRVNDYIREANAKEIAYDVTDLMARGMTQVEMDTVKAWRNFWDGHFYLENLDLVRSLNSQGYQRLMSSNADVFARPVRSTAGVGKVYDPTLDTVLTLSGEAEKSLYEAGGFYARLRRPTQFGNETVEHIVVRNSSDEYLRAIRDTDQVLNYREGYYQVSYNAPRFVDEITDKGRRAVAVAGDTAEAEAFASRMRVQNPDATYQVRADDRAMRTTSDDWFDIHSASGRVAQRHRGKLLEDASGLNLLGDGSYVVNPVDSAIHAAKSIAGRTISRPMLEAAKARFINQYTKFLPSDGMGGVRFPRSVEDIGAKGMFVSSEVADARTTYEYIRYLENGYINSMDNIFKATFHAIADMLGARGFSKAERAALQGAEVSVSGLGKGAVFGAYIGTNPLRQWIVQTHQSIRTWSYNPQGWINGNIQKLLGQYLGDMVNVTKSPEGLEFAKFVNESGLMAAVDKQNLVRGTLLTAADQGNALTRSLGAVPGALRRVGFDLGEMANQLVHAAAVYERYKRLGKDLADVTTRNEAYSEIRAISYDMNFAGDMPYNQTTPSIILQFMQVPHKAFLQATNRRIDPMIRARLIAADMIMWGPPTLLVSELMGGDILPDNPKLREAFVYGVESMMLNAALRKQFDTNDINIDFSSLAPYDMTGWAEFFHAMMSGGALQAITNSPTGALLKEGGRVQTAIQSMGRFFGITKDEYDSPQEALSVVNDVLSISSGWNNAVKAHIALETGKVYDKYGNVIDKTAHPIEAYMMALGFNTANQRDMYLATKKATEKTKAFKEEVTQVLDDAARYYQRELSKGNTNVEYMTKVTGFVLRKYEGNPEAMKITQEWMTTKLFQDKETQLVYMMMKAAGIPEGNVLKDSIRQMPVSDEQKNIMLQRIDDVEKATKKGE